MRHMAASRRDAERCGQLARSELRVHRGQPGIQRVRTPRRGLSLARARRRARDAREHEDILMHREHRLPLPAPFGVRLLAEGHPQCLRMRERLRSLLASLLQQQSRPDIHRGGGLWSRRPQRVREGNDRTERALGAVEQAGAKIVLGQREHRLQAMLVAERRPRHDALVNADRAFHLAAPPVDAAEREVRLDGLVVDVDHAQEDFERLVGLLVQQETEALEIVLVEPARRPVACPS